ncbi:hypothetical protein AVEN_226107-1 [Araneus ventricosus]|uniref:Uncharacterized protein n=1 Tax=Araneus ventricosus TaxID=182803 RepID=A0A4Y2I5P4_ARAVE|nr:hypothetical protein AVEN_226107-1 [Araneus ventricosus]
MRRGRQVKSQGFVGFLITASNRKPRSLSHLIIGRGSEPKGFPCRSPGRSSPWCGLFARRLRKGRGGLVVRSKAPGLEGSRPETRFHRRYAVYGACCTLNHT